MMTFFLYMSAAHLPFPPLFGPPMRPLTLSTGICTMPCSMLPPGQGTTACNNLNPTPSAHQSHTPPSCPYQG